MKKNTDILFISEKDVIRTGVLSSENKIKNAEEVFKLLSQGDYRMGGNLHNAHGISVTFPEKSNFKDMPTNGPDRRFVAMPAYLGGNFHVVGNKWYGSNAANKGKNLPRSILTLMLNDANTGAPVSLMSANMISAGRTGAVAAVGSKYLSEKKPESIAVVGCGPINRACLEQIMYLHPTISKVYLFNHSVENAEKINEFVLENYQVETYIATDPLELKNILREASIVSVAASRTHPLLIKDSWIKPGALVILSGPITADDKFWVKNKIVYDHIGLHKNYVLEAKASGNKEDYYGGVIGGEIYNLIDAGQIKGFDDALSIGDVIRKQKTGRESEQEKIIFVSCGMSVFDVGLGYCVYTEAKNKGLGKEVSLWD